MYRGTINTRHQGGPSNYQSSLTGWNWSWEKLRIACMLSAIDAQNDGAPYASSQRFIAKKDIGTTIGIEVMKGFNVSQTIWCISRLKLIEFKNFSVELTCRSNDLAATIYWEKCYYSEDKSVAAYYHYMTEKDILEEKNAKAKKITRVSATSSPDFLSQNCWRGNINWDLSRHSGWWYFITDSSCCICCTMLALCCLSQCTTQILYVSSKVLIMTGQMWYEWEILYPLLQANMCTLFRILPVFDLFLLVKIFVLELKWHIHSLQLFVPRGISHPLFKNISMADTALELQSKQPGECILRPSPKSCNFICLSIKLFNGQNKSGGAVIEHRDLHEGDKVCI